MGMQLIAGVELSREMDSPIYTQLMAKKHLFAGPAWMECRNSHMLGEQYLMTCISVFHNSDWNMD